MSKALPAPLPWASFDTTIIAVQNVKHLPLVVRSLSFVIVECIHKFALIE